MGKPLGPWLAIAMLGVAAIWGVVEASETAASDSPGAVAYVQEWSFTEDQVSGPVALRAAVWPSDGPCTLTVSKSDRGSRYGPTSLVLRYSIAGDLLSWHRFIHGGPMVAYDDVDSRAITDTMELPSGTGVAAGWDATNAGTTVEVAFARVRAAEPGSSAPALTVRLQCETPPAAVTFGGSRQVFLFDSTSFDQGLRAHAIAGALVTTVGAAQASALAGRSLALDAPGTFLAHLGAGAVGELRLETPADAHEWLVTTPEPVVVSARGPVGGYRVELDRVWANQGSQAFWGLLVGWQALAGPAELPGLPTP